MKTASSGSKFQAGRKGTEIAALIRGEIRAACKADGPLKGYKVSVRFRWATHSKAIDIEIQDAPANIMTPEWVRANAAGDWRATEGVRRFTPIALAAQETLRTIAAQFNRFDSDSQSDYYNDEFFCSVDFAHDLEDAHTAKILSEGHPACCGCAACELAYAA